MANVVISSTQQQQSSSSDEFSNWEVLNQSDFELSSDDDDVKSFDSFSFSSSVDDVGEEGEREEPTKEDVDDDDHDEISRVLEDAEKMWQGYLNMVAYDHHDDNDGDGDDDVMGTSPPEDNVNDKVSIFIDDLVAGTHGDEFHDHHHDVDDDGDDDVDGVMGIHKYENFRGHMVDGSCGYGDVVMTSLHLSDKVSIFMDDKVDDMSHGDDVFDDKVSNFVDDDGSDGDGDDDDDDGYDVDDELVPWEFKGKFGRERMRKLGKRGYSKLGKTKRTSLLYNKPGCVRGKHGLGLKAY